MEETKTYRTFVYGSLRRGEFNHDRFRGFPESFKCAGFIRKALLKPLGPYPCIVPSEDEQDVVQGEIYDLPESLHNVILNMEVNAGYVFNPVSVEVLANADEAPGKTVPIEASAYFYANPERVRGIAPIKSGDWTSREVRERRNL